jgi:tetratricopeptide (TPR) repeat protein
MSYPGLSGNFRAKWLRLSAKATVIVALFSCVAYAQTSQSSGNGPRDGSRGTSGTTIQEQIAGMLHLIEQGKEQHLSEQRMGYLWGVLASDYRKAGDFSHSEAASLQAIELLKSHEDASRNYAIAIDNLSLLYLTYGRLDEARQYNGRAAAIRKEKGYRLDVARSDVHMAEIDLARHRFKEVEEEAARGLAVMDEMHDPEPKDLISALNALTYTRCLRKRCAEGMEAAQRSLELARAHFGPESIPTADALMSVGFALWKMGRVDDAGRTMRSAVEVMRRQAGPQSRPLLLLLALYRDYLKDTRRNDEVDEITHEITQVRSREPLCGACVTVNSLRGSAK